MWRKFMSRKHALPPTIVVGGTDFIVRGLGQRGVKAAGTPSLEPDLIAAMRGLVFVVLNTHLTAEILRETAAVKARHQKIRFVVMGDKNTERAKFRELADPEFLFVDQDSDRDIMLTRIHNTMKEARIRQFRLKATVFLLVCLSGMGLGFAISSSPFVKFFSVFWTAVLSAEWLILYARGKYLKKVVTSNPKQAIASGAV
jgi:hypothetical protein